MNETTLTKTRTRVQERETSQTGIDAITKTLIVALGGISGVIGLWALASVVGAMVTNGGPLALITGWIGAVTGM
jgi:hypothetical protein